MNPFIGTLFVGMVVCIATAFGGCKEETGKMADLQEPLARDFYLAHSDGKPVSAEVREAQLKIVVAEENKHNAADRERSWLVRTAYDEPDDFELGMMAGSLALHPLTHIAAATFEGDEGARFVAKGNTIVRIPEFAYQSRFRRAYVFDGTKLVRTVPFRQLAIEALPEAYVTLYREMGADEAALWKHGKTAELKREAAQRGPGWGFENSRCFFSLRNPHIGGGDRQVLAFKVPKSKVLEWAKGEKVDVGVFPSGDIVEAAVDPSAYDELADHLVR